MHANAPNASGVIGASEPPAIIASATPVRIMFAASPIECAPVAHADTAAKFGPLSPNRIATEPAAPLIISSGTVNGLIFDGPRSRRTRCCASSVSIPPMPEPMHTPTRPRSTGGSRPPARVLDGLDGRRDARTA